MQSFLAIETLQCADEPGSPFLIALGVPAPTVVGHVVEDQGLGFSVFKAGPPTSRTAQPSGEKVILGHDVLLSILQLPVLLVMEQPGTES